MRKRIYLTMFVLYAFMIVRLTIYRNSGAPVYTYPHVNLRLFEDLLSIKSNSTETFLYLLVGNIICFIPLGFFIREFTGKGIIKVILICLSISVVIELTQYFLMVGVFELDDIILNTFGSALGLLLWILVESYSKRRNADV